MNKIDSAKQILKEFIPTINSYLLNVWEKEQSNIKIQYPDIEKLAKFSMIHAQAHNLRTAKRLRASFVYNSYIMLGGTNNKEVLHACAAVELVHTALLMQDDFADRDAIRRGKITTHKYFKEYHKKNLDTGDASHYGDGMAVFLGDIILTLGYRTMNDIKFDDKLTRRVVESLLNAIIETGYGQLYDITLEAKESATENDVVNLHLAKTSIYTYKNPLQIGAILAGASDDDLQLINNYAIPGGIAFQLQDDVLGIFGDNRKTGKSNLADIREGKKTLLIIKALEKATASQRRKINKIIGNPDITQSDGDDIRQIIVDTGSLKYSKEIATRYARDSQKFIPQMLNRGWAKAPVNFLDGIAEYMAIGRDK